MKAQANFSDDKGLKSSRTIFLCDVYGKVSYCNSNINAVVKYVQRGDAYYAVHVQFEFESEKTSEIEAFSSLVSTFFLNYVLNKFEEKSHKGVFSEDRVGNMNSSMLRFSFERVPHESYACVIS